MPGLAAAGVELAHRCFVGMQARLLPQQFGEPVGERLQGHADAPDPLGQRRAGQRHALAGGDLFDPVQRQMVQVFAGRDHASRPTAAMPPSMTAGAIKAAVSVWHGRHAYCGRI